MMTPWVVLALLLGTLGLSPLVLSAAQAVRLERDSLALGQATWLAADLAARLHLNAVSAPLYQLDWGQMPASPNCLDAPCSRADWATSDLAHWRQRVEAELPDGDAWLHRSNDGSGTWMLVLAWTSHATDTQTPSASSFTYTCPPRKRCLAMTGVP
jgi:hypothetical protein